MKKYLPTISLFVLGILLVSMSAMVFTSKAQQANLKNPYDSGTLGVDDIIDTYNNNINKAFNNYIKLMMTNMQTNPDDPNGKPFHADGTPFSVSDCFNSPQNYSTFCVAANLLGGNSDDCPAVTKDKTTPLSEGMDAFCQLGGNALPLQGYMNFIAALKKRTQNIFDTQADQQCFISKVPVAGPVVGKSLCSTSAFFGSIPLINQIVKRKTDINQAFEVHKNLCRSGKIPRQDCGHPPPDGHLPEEIYRSYHHGLHLNL